MVRRVGSGQETVIHELKARQQYVAKLVDEVASDDAVFIPDVGSPVIWAARYLRMNGRRKLIGSFIHGSMANALPQATGVASVGSALVDVVTERQELTIPPSVKLEQAKGCAVRAADPAVGTRGRAG